MTWSSAPSDNAPAQKITAGWGGTEDNSGHGFWLGRLEKVAPYAGTGNLSGGVMPRVAVGATFSGMGNYQPVPAAIEHRSAALSGLGLPTGLMFQTIARTALFSAMLALTYAFDDGLSAAISSQYVARFGGEGTFLPGVTSSQQLPDGLFATAIGHYLMAGLFSGTGGLTAAVLELEGVLGSFSGGGSLSANLTLSAYIALLSGSGSLSASAVALYSRLAALAGSGALTASVLMNFLTAAGFSGAGAFTARFFQLVQEPASEGGTGTVTALISQIYTIAAALAGSGALTATVAIGGATMTGALAGSGSLSAVVHATLSLPIPLPYPLGVI